MNQKLSQLDTGSIRTNKDIEMAVNRGLAASMLNGMAVGAAIMKAAGVPLHVSTRVLADPNRRRGTDWHQNSTPPASEPTNPEAL
ncbi:MAG: hypothetical protein JO002_10210 [Burkholderiaceae bacterium]|nr:hypothetical protein [Burkholderiaceae bacterium]